MSILLNIISNQRPNYCHAIECTYVEDLKVAVEDIIYLFSNYHAQDFIDFFELLQVYYIQDESLSQAENDTLENELYAFNFSDYIKESM